jgi:hypothetical protein
LGDHAGQRDADADGATSLPLRLHHQRHGTLGRGGGAPVSVQSAFSTNDADQIAKAFRRSFGADPPGFVLKLGGLTPADFATVSRKASVLGERDSKTIAQWLEYEAQARPDAGRRRIGF